MDMLKMLAACGIACIVGVIVVAVPGKAEAQCFQCVLDNPPCTTCVRRNVGEGFQFCQATCDMVCSAEGDCTLTLKDFQIGPDGSVLADASRPVPPSPVGSSEIKMGFRFAGLADPDAREDHGKQQLRGCRGWVLGRHYTEEALAELRRASAVIRI